MSKPEVVAAGRAVCLSHRDATLISQTELPPARWGGFRIRTVPVGSRSVVCWVSAVSLVSITGPSSVLGASGRSQCASLALSVCSPPEGGALGESVSDSCPVGPPLTLFACSPCALCAVHSVDPLGAARSLNQPAVLLVRAPFLVRFSKGSLAAVLGGLGCPRGVVRALQRLSARSDCAPPRAPLSRPYSMYLAVRRTQWFVAGLRPR